MREEFHCARGLHGSILRVFGKKSNAAIATGLLITVILWGASNAGTKYVLRSWPPIWTGATRFFFAGALMLALLKWTRLFGTPRPISRALSRELWWRGGLSLAVYVLLFNWAMWLTSASHVALYLGTAPVWALVWEERPQWNRRSAQRYGAALLALSGVVVLFWPMKSGNVKLTGEFMGLAASVLWAAFGRQVRALSDRLPGAEISAETMWRAGALLGTIRAGGTLAQGRLGVGFECRAGAALLHRRRRCLRIRVMEQCVSILEHEPGFFV